MSEELTVEAGNPAQDQVEKSTQPEPVATLDPGVNERLLAESKEHKQKAQAKAKEAAELRRKLADIEAQQAAEQGKYKELYEAQKSRNDELENSIVRGAVEAKFKEAAIKAGCQDADAALKLANADLLQYDVDTREVLGVDVALEDLKEKRAFLFQANPKTVINPASPGGTISKQQPKGHGHKSKDEILNEWKELEARG